MVGKDRLDPHNRLGFDGNLQVVVDAALDFYGIGACQQAVFLAEGYEDSNIRVTTALGSYVFKFFADNQLGDYAKTRRDSDVVERLVDIIEAVRRNGGHVPIVHTDTNGRHIFRDSQTGLTAICYGWIKGSTLYDLNAAPTTEQLGQIIEQAIIINTTPLTPGFYLDIWALPNLPVLRDRVYQSLGRDERQIVDKISARFAAIPFAKLSKCLVHGDLTKGNVLLTPSGDIKIIDFSVANYTYRMLEVAVLVANCMFDAKQPTPVRERLQAAVDVYDALSPLTAIEKQSPYDICITAAAMEFLDSVWRQVSLHDESEETQYWRRLGLTTLRQELA